MHYQKHPVTLKLILSSVIVNSLCRSLATSIGNIIAIYGFNTSPVNWDGLPPSHRPCVSIGDISNPALLGCQAV